METPLFLCAKVYRSSKFPCVEFASNQVKFAAWNYCFLLSYCGLRFKKAGSKPKELSCDNSGYSVCIRPSLFVVHFAAMNGVRLALHVGVVSLPTASWENVLVALVPIKVATTVL